jgi:hypothetical protein
MNCSLLSQEQLPDLRPTPFLLNCFDFQAVWGKERESRVWGWCLIMGGWGTLISLLKSLVNSWELGEGSALILTHSCGAWPGSSGQWGGGTKG